MINHEQSFSCQHCSKLSTILFSIVTPESEQFIVGTMHVVLQAQRSLLCTRLVMLHYTKLRNQAKNLILPNGWLFDVVQYIILLVCKKVLSVNKNELVS